MSQVNYLNVLASFQARVSQYLAQCNLSTQTELAKMALSSPMKEEEQPVSAGGAAPAAPVKSEPERTDADGDATGMRIGPDSVVKANLSFSPSSTETDQRSGCASSFQEGVTVGYTFDALFVSDGRSKRRRSAPKEQQRYKCSQCGKSYATSSNLSRHKQTHRPLDSHYAKRCPDCSKAYVSMPALR